MTKKLYLSTNFPSQNMLFICKSKNERFTCYVCLKIVDSLVFCRSVTLEVSHRITSPLAPLTAIKRSYKIFIV